MTEHIAGTKFPTKEAVIEHLKKLRPEWDEATLEEKYVEQQKLQTIMLDQYCGLHGKYQQHAYDEEGFHQYHTIPKCPKCEAHIQPVVIVKTSKGFMVAEITTYTYGYLDGAIAFAKEKWGDDAPVLALEAVRCQLCKNGMSTGDCDHGAGW